METAKKRRPFGFYVCAMGFTFERLAFYTVKYLLAIWLATEVTSGGLGLSDAEGAAMSASFVAWTYITPIFGGYIADYWLSPRLCVALGYPGIRWYRIVQGESVRCERTVIPRRRRTELSVLYSVFFC